MRTCIAAKIATGEIVHVDASLIRADVVWEGLAVRHVEAITEANGDAASDPGHAPEPKRALRDSRKTGRFKKVCLTDPDATMATNGRRRRLEPSYKQHGVLDDVFGVVLDVEVTTGETNEGEQRLARLDAAAETTGMAIETVTADAGHACAKLSAGLERRGIAAGDRGVRHRSRTHGDTMARSRPRPSRSARRSRCAAFATTPRTTS